MTLLRRPTPALLGLQSLAAGVLLGIGGLRWVFLVAAAGGVFVAWLRPTLRVAVLAFVAGSVHGLAARWADRGRCPARLEAGLLEVTLRLVEPAAPGRPARAAIEAPCRGSILVRHRGTDTLWAGTTARVEGRWIPRLSRWHPAGGLPVIRTVGSPTGAEAPRSQGRVSPIDRLRNWMVATIGRQYGPRSGMIEALVLGNRGTIEPSLSQAFARSGLVHLLSISGFHVGLIWGWVVLGLGAVGGRRWAPAAAAAIVVSYVAFLGAPAPALRATLLGLLSAVETARQRRVAPGGLAAVVAGLVLLADPWSVTDLGAWLSVAALWGATAAARWSERVLGTAALWTVLASSVGATVATAPLSALVFGSVSVIGVGLNLIAIPLASFALPAVLMGLAVEPLWKSAADALATGGGFLLHLLELTAVQGGRAPGAAVTFEPGPMPALLAVIAIGVLVWLFERQNRVHEVLRRAGWLGATGSVAWLAVALARSAQPNQGGGATLHFLDVGQGDAALVETASGRWILFDAGPKDDRGDAGRRVVVPFLIRHGVRRLAAVVVSHGHRDHFGGLPAVMEAVEVERVFEPGLPVPDREYLELLDQLVDRGIGWRALRAGDRLAVDEVEVEVIHPDTAWSGWGVDLNENSVVVKLRAGRFDAMLVGDAGFPVEDRLVSTVGSVEILKVGHHGSRSATGAAWLRQIRPAAAVISVGTNRYGHPAPELMTRLEAARVPVWRTDRDGTVTVRVGSDAIRIASRRGETVLPLHE